MPRFLLLGLFLILLFWGAHSTAKPPTTEVDPELDPQTENTIELVRYAMDQWSGGGVTTNRVESNYTASALSAPSDSNLERFKRYDNMGYATLPVLQVIGHAHGASNAYARSRYFEFSVSGDLNLHALHFKVAKGDSAHDRGFSVRTSVDNYASVLFSVKDVPTERPKLTSYQVDLGAPQFQGLKHITVRIYIHTNSTSRTLEFDDIRLLGKPASVNFSLHGNPNFSTSNLSSEERLWYKRLWAALRHSDPSSKASSQARSGNLYDYARPLNETITVMLYAFRATGDLRLLDEIDRHLQLMRKELRTTWVDVNGNSVTPNDGTKDFRRWLFLRDSSDYGKDTRIMDAVMAHALVAEAAYAFMLNRDLSSPSGVPYGQRAEFWREYLVNDFEQIWRIRTGETGKDYWDHQVSHSWGSNVRWLYYMGQLTDEAAYHQEALVKGRALVNNQLDVSTPAGTAKIWSHKLFDYSYGLQAFVYVRYDWMILTSLHLDGFTLYDRSLLEKHAVTLSHFMMDNGSTDFSFDVGGMQDRTGTRLTDNTRYLIRTRDPWDGSSLTYARETRSRYATSALTQLAAFDPSGKIRTVSEAVYRAVESELDNPRRPFIPAGIFFTLRMSR